MMSQFKDLLGRTRPSENDIVYSVTHVIEIMRKEPVPEDATIRTSRFISHWLDYVISQDWFTLEDGMILSQSMKEGKLPLYTIPVFLTSPSNVQSAKSVLSKLNIRSYEQLIIAFTPNAEGYQGYQTIKAKEYIESLARMNSILLAETIPGMIKHALNVDQKTTLGYVLPGEQSNSSIILRSAFVPSPASKPFRRPDFIPVNTITRTDVDNMTRIQLNSKGTFYNEDNKQFEKRTVDKTKLKEFYDLRKTTPRDLESDD